MPWKKSRNTTDYDARDCLWRRKFAACCCRRYSLRLNDSNKILEEGRKNGIFTEVVPFLIHMMILGSILFYKGAVPIKDKQMWLPADVRARDKKLKGSLGEEVAMLILKAIKK